MTLIGFQGMHTKSPKTPLIIIIRIANVPDPFIRIFHYCNEPKGEQLELPEFYTFVVGFRSCLDNFA